MAEPSPYHVIVDRISHDIPFYRGYLKNAALSGTVVINNPFWWSADDKFFNFALGTKLGVAIPKTVLLPHKEHPPGTTDRSMRNLQFPMPWDSIFSYVGFPGIPEALRRRRLEGRLQGRTRRRSSSTPTIRARDLCMTLQRGVKFKEYFRCYVVGQEKVHIMHYDPSAPFHERYVKNPPPDRSQAAGARGARLPHPVPCPGLRPEHGRVCLRGRHPVRHRLHESCSRR